MDKVSGVADNFATLGLLGIDIGTDGKLSIHEDKFNDYLESNFDDLKRVFVADWSSTIVI